ERQRIAAPAHAARRVGAQRAVDRAFDWQEQRVQARAVAAHDPRQIQAQRPAQADGQGEDQEDFDHDEHRKVVGRSPRIRRGLGPARLRWKAKARRKMEPRRVPRVAGAPSEIFGAQHDVEQVRSGHQDRDRAQHREPAGHGRVSCQKDAWIAASTREPARESPKIRSAL
ncbi:hypothetical protein CATMIT_01907, partial [Catenibacterium mitsuokai DSM 15897]